MKLSIDSLHSSRAVGGLRACGANPPYGKARRGCPGRAQITSFYFVIWRRRRLVNALLLGGGAPRTALAVAALDVVDDHLLEVVRHRRAAQGRDLLAVDEDRRGRLLAGAGQRDADVGVLALARS